MDKTSSRPKANTRQVDGDHYQAEIQHWDFAASQNFDYFQGQITKYVTRWKKKNGVTDLKKALHFLEKYIELNEPPKELPKVTELSFHLEHKNEYGATYTCDKCGTQVFVKGGQLPWQVHGDCPDRNYVNQD